MLCLGIIKLALASALGFSYLYVAGHGRFRSLRIFCRKIRVTMKTAKRMKRVLGWLLVCLPVAAGAQSVQDSLAIAAIRWDTCCVRPHLVAVQAQLELFGAPQAISMVRYDAGRYRTRIDAYVGFGRGGGGRGGRERGLFQCEDARSLDVRACRRPDGRRDRSSGRVPRQRRGDDKGAPRADRTLCSGGRRAARAALP